MHRFFSSNLGFRIISILLAVGLWLYVTLEQNPVQERVMQVPLEVRNVSQKLIVSDKPESVKVRLSGRKNVLNDLNSRKDLKAYVDLEGAKVGTNQENVNIVAPKGLKIEEVTPFQVGVKMDQFSQVQLPVKAELRGTVATGYYRSQPVIKPTKVVIKGPNSILDTIDQVFVSTNLRSSSKNIEELLPIQIKDKKGNFIQDSLGIKPESVTLYISVLPVQLPKKLIVQPTIEGNLPEGYSIKEIVTEPKVVEVSAETNRNTENETADYLTTEPINVDSTTTDITQEVNIVTPKGFTVNPKTVKVIIKIEKNS
ncbi:CdaR family protein [Bacillota bacterium LX-D]|nr:CdaR family protein [Bacillota bacterium LX-D]